jgi:serine/threonine protein kinase
MSDPLITPTNEKDLLLATMDLPTHQRLDYLNKACGSDIKLKARVKELLRNAEDQGSFMAQPAVDISRTTALSSISVGGQIGRYRLMEQIGEGGMGVVYVAEQVEPVRRKVALKVIKPGMDSKQVIARFEAERQALAMMDHANIARVLDAGTTEQGLPYFVMELVRGLPITEYCDKAKASTHERLELFIDVCDAVNHAHQKGIIHRDIKPGNVLVTLHDSKPVVKVIDFGVAKALHQQLTQHTVYTALNQVVGTPLYMSPEQVELSGLDIDTRTDVYSLGVLLYELLTGSTPFDRDRLLKSGFDEMRRIIREEEPLRPSYRITTMPKAELSTVANKRGIDDRTFSKSVQSELDWITLKALEKDRNRRYESANGLGADVRRYLSNEPVTAFPPSTAYQLRKLIHRHSGVVIVAGATMLSLLIGLSLTAWQWRRAVAAEQDTASALQLVEQKATLATKRLVIAEQVIDEMYTQFAQDWLSQQSQLTNVQREYLEKAVAAFEQLAAQDPTDTKPRTGAIVAKYRSGAILKELGRIDEAITTLDQCVELCHIAIESSPYDVDLNMSLAQAQISIAGIYRNKRNQTEKLKYADAAYAALQEIERTGQLTELQKVLLSKGFSNCALQYASDKTRKSEARKAADLGVAIARQLCHIKPLDLAHKERLADSLSAKGQQCLWWGEQNEECLLAYKESIELDLQLVTEAPDRQNVLKSLPGSMQNYSVVLRRLKREDEAEELNLKKLEIARKLASRFPDLPDCQAQFGAALRIAGNTEHRRGNFNRADDYWSESITVLSNVADQFPDLRYARKELVIALLQNGAQHVKDRDYQGAVGVFESANLYFMRFAKNFPTDTEMFILHRTLLRNLAIGYLQTGEHEKSSATGQQLLGLIGLPENSESYYPSEFQRQWNDLLLFIYVHRINFYCANLINADSRFADQAANESVSGTYEKNSQELLDRVQTLAVTWLQSQESSVEVWRELLTRIDEKDEWQLHGRQPTLDNFSNDSSLQTRALLLDAFVDKFVDTTPLPDIWPSVMLTVASAKEFSLSAERQLELCDLGWQQSPNAPLASQAYAWTLFRNAQWQECVDMLQKEPESNNDENGFILAMALWHLDRKEQAEATLDAASQWLNENQEQLETRREAKPMVQQPNSETLARLKQEAEQLIRPNAEK